MSNESGDPSIDQLGKGGETDFIKRLLAASEPPELDNCELALLEAHLKQPYPWFAAQRERRRIGKPSDAEDRRNRLSLIRSYNQKLRSLTRESPVLTKQDNTSDAVQASVDATDIPRSRLGKTTLSGEERALALLVRHPEWTDKRIASAVPCARQSLYRWHRYVAARETLKSGRNHLPKGVKNGETGKIEASHDIEEWEP